MRILSPLILLAAALALSGAAAPRPARLVPTAYDRLPGEVRAGVGAVMDDILSGSGDACPSTAARYARAAKVFRADLDGDGIDDFVLDEWSGECFRNPAHVIHVWLGEGGGRFRYVQHVDAFLERGPGGFAWLQTRCDQADRARFMIESDRAGKRTASPCYPAADLKAQMRRRGLADAFPR